MDNKIEQDLKINKFKLEDACEEQPSLYMYYAEEYAKKKAEKDNYDDKLDFISSKVEMEIRENPPDGLKVTESTIKSLLSTDKRIIEIKEKLRAVKEDLYHLDAVVKALEHRKSELNNLVSLYIAGYYSMPSGKRQTPNDKARNKIRQNLNRKDN